jgi:hypothetical protein
MCIDQVAIKKRVCKDSFRLVREKDESAFTVIALSPVPFHLFGKVKSSTRVLTRSF